MTATLTPAVQDLFSRYAKLSPQEQVVFREQVVSTVAETDGLGLPAWTWEVLKERAELAAQGLDQPIPWEDAKLELRKKWGREMRISIRPIASRDIDDAAEFGDLQEPGLGREIYALLEAEIDGLLQTAGLHPKRRGFYCHVIRHRFPYFCVFYTLNDDEIQVRAVLDGRRDPRDNQRKLNDR